jgi:hypothetical protein
MHTTPAAQVLPECFTTTNSDSREEPATSAKNERNAQSIGGHNSAPWNLKGVKRGGSRLSCPLGTGHVALQERSARSRGEHVGVGVNIARGEELLVDLIGNDTCLAGEHRLARPHSTFMFHGVGFDGTAGHNATKGMTNADRSRSHRIAPASYRQ